MRRPFTRVHCREAGISLAQLRWKLETGQWQAIHRGVYIAGDSPPTALERALATLVAVDGVASHSLAGLAYGLDSVELGESLVTVTKRPKRMLPGLRIRSLDPMRIVEVNGHPCTDGLQTLVDLASVLDDIRWEHALENALRNKLTTIDEISAAIPAMNASRVAGLRRIKRLLALRPENAPPTESLLETLAVQLIRAEPLLPEPERQVEILNKYGDFVARVDLAWPQFGVFIELDGQHHKDQPVYDARRETAVVAATGWLPARFTWHEVRNIPRSTTMRLLDIVDMARLRSPS